MGSLLDVMVLLLSNSPIPFSGGEYDGDNLRLTRKLLSFNIEQRDVCESDLNMVVYA